MRNFKDESFIGQYLSPKLMREMRLFAIRDDEKQSELKSAAIHDDAGYRRDRVIHLAAQAGVRYSLTTRTPTSTATSSAS
jgi:spore cortex formation protein SpoVR/YcgB (stage V sporulation)